MGSLVRFAVFILITVFGRIFYRYETEWVGESKDRTFDGIRLGLLLNHTSLYEPLYAGALPLSFLWRIASCGVFPGADVTMNRPLAGFLFRLLAPTVVTITRKRDESWSDFLGRIRPDSLILMAPEGRMKRKGGLDKEGNPMTVRGGVADVLQRVKEGKLLIAYSGGLHHINCPGERFPRVFKTMRMRFETLEISDYLRSLGFPNEEFKARLIRDLEQRRDRHCLPEVY